MRDPRGIAHQALTFPGVVRVHQVSNIVRKKLGAAAEFIRTTVTSAAQTEHSASPIDHGASEEEKPESDEFNCIGKSVVQLAIDHWRLTRRIRRLEAASPEANVSSIIDSAQRIGEGLQELGVTTAELDGAMHDPGALYEVVHIREECDTQVVVETIAPSVLINGKIVKHGQVVIGCESTEESGT